MITTSNRKTRTGETIPGVLRAGAGAAEIIFPDEMFPMSEGFVGIHDNPHARILLVENGERAAFVALEMNNVPSDSLDSLRKIVQERTGTPPDNIWIQCTHVNCTPHAPTAADARSLFLAALDRAVTEAAEQAAGAFQEARFGLASGPCQLTTGRNVRTEDGGWVWGLNGVDRASDKLQVMMFTALKGEVIGLVTTYSIRSNCANTLKSTPDRLITSDSSGVAMRILEEEFHAPALFLPTAYADLNPVEAAVLRDDATADLGIEEGLAIAERIGTRLAQAALRIAGGVQCTDTAAEVRRGEASYTWPNKAGDGALTIDMLALTVGGAAFIGVKPEVNYATLLELQAASPYEYTFLMGFVNGDQKYMPNAENYDHGKPAALVSGFARGAAEQCVAAAVSLLNGIRSGAAASASAANPAEGDGPGAVCGTGETLEFGGQTWVVLEKREDRELILCKNTVTAMAYRGAGGCATWEVSDVRAYLNGDFYERFFSEAEKARILKTPLKSVANPQYGTSSGRDTVDKVFLLTGQEAAKYMTTSECRIAYNDSGEPVMWLLRQPGRDNEYVSDVNTSGYIDYHGILVLEAGSLDESGISTHVKDYASSVNGGIRPAMWIELDGEVCTG